MPYIKYISVDSSYRNRVQYPLPSQFAVTMGCPSTIVSPISPQTPVYPRPTPLGSSNLELESIFFAEPTASSVNSADEITYLPYLHCVTRESECTQFRLEPLVLQSVTSDDLTKIQTSNDYPLGVVPLERYDNAYIGDILENASLGETRQIISSTYTDQEIVLQTLTIIEWTINENGNTDFKIIVDFLNSFPSPIYRFYVGKYIKVNNVNLLIINSVATGYDNRFTTTSRSAIIITITVRGTTEKPVLPVTSQIVAAESWFVEVDRAFSIDPPFYPTYNNSQPGIQIPITVTDVPLSYETDLENYEAHDIIRHSDLTIGIVVQTGTKLLYYRSTDNTGSVFNSRVLISDGLFTNPIPNFTGFLSSGISLALIDGIPSVAFTTYTFSGEVKLNYIHANNSTGTSWSDVYQIASGTVESGFIKLLPSPDDTFGDGTIFTGDPIIFYTNLGNSINYTGNPSHDGSGVWVNTDTTKTGTLLDANLIYFENGGATYKKGVGFAYNNTLDEFVFTQYHPSVIVDNIISPSVADQSQVVPVPFFISFGILETMPFLIFRQGTNVYGVAYALLNDGGSLFLLQVNQNGGVTLPELIYDNATSFHAAVIGTPTSSPINGVPPSLPPIDVTILDGQDILQLRIAPNNIAEATSTLISSRFNTRDIKTLSPSGPGILFSYITAGGGNLIEGYGNKLLVNFTENTSFYRIRNGIPVTTGENNLIGVTSTSFTLPSVESISIGDYMWIYNTPVTPTPVPSELHLYNDIVRVVDVNRMTNTITTDRALSGSINTFGSNNGGGNTYRWEIWGSIRDSFHQLEFVGESSLVMQAVCYYVRLITLTLPNITLSVGNGNLIAFYPYVYVQFESQSVSHRSVIISNNPNSRRVLFKVPITNIVSPDRSTFVNLNGGGMEHIIAFTPMDSFIFSVFLPTGEVFQTLRQDTPLPFAVDNTLQVSATFQVRLASDYYEEQQQ